MPLARANMLYNQLEKGIQVGDPLQAVRRLVPPTEAAAQLRGFVHHHYELCYLSKYFSAFSP